jgi:hypothetical protein
MLKGEKLMVLMVEKCKHKNLAILWGDSDAWFSKGMIFKMEKDGHYYIDEEDDDWECNSGGESDIFLAGVECMDCGKVLVEAHSEFADNPHEEDIIKKVKELEP